jgi:phage baseplate assembly protein gpV
MTAIATLAPVISVDGTMLSAAQLGRLTHLRVERGIRLIGRITLRFDDLGFDIAESGAFALGKTLQVSAGGKLLMTGVITGTQIDQHGGETPELLITADDAAVALTRGTRVATYEKMSYSDVVSKLLGEVSMTGDIEPTRGKHEYLIRSGSALQFLEDIADRTGYDWWVGGAEGKTLIFKPPAESTPALAVSLGEDLRDFSVRATGLHPTSVAVTGWQPGTQAAVGSGDIEVLKGDPAAPALDNADFAKHIGSSAALSKAAATTGQPGALSSEEATELATALSARAAAGAVSARGTIDASALAAPGETILVQKAGPASGKYRITRVEHVYSQRTGFVTKFATGERRPTTLVDLLGQRPTSAFSHDGLVTGVVTDTKDPDTRGRVRVMFVGVTDTDTSAWARVATQGAGDNRGFVVMPEVGDEVLVGFEHGDTRRPVVLGGLFGDKRSMKGAMDQYGLTDGSTVGRALVSRMGYRMEISDGTEPAKQHVRLSLEKGDAHMFRLGKDKVQITVPDSVPVEIKAGAKASFTIDAQGNVTIRGQKVSIEAQQELSVKSAAGAVVVSAAAGDLKMDGLRFALKGTAAGEVNAAGSLALKGGMVQIN